ncbi:MAG: oleate hydratase [Rhodanobacter sp.]
MGKYYFVGSGIAARAGAAPLIRDGGASGKDIVMFEESRQFGGVFDAHGNLETGYYMSGSRMFEAMHQCTFDLLASIPSLSHPNVSIKEETDQANAAMPWHNKVRLVDRDGNIPDARTMGFSEQDRLDLVKIMVEPERMLDDKRISDCFEEHCRNGSGF